MGQPNRFRNAFVKTECQRVTGQSPSAISKADAATPRSSGFPKIEAAKNKINYQQEHIQTPRTKRLTANIFHPLFTLVLTQLGRRIPDGGNVSI